MALVKSPIFRAMNRPDLYMGGDRQLMLITLLIAFTFAFTSMSFGVIVFAIIFLVSVVYGLQQMAKADPQMRDIYIKHRSYKAFYPAQSSPFHVD